MTKKADSNKSSTPNGAGTPTSSGMELFFTAAKASEGLRMPLRDPMGNKTEHWLHIIGVDSDEFRLADAATKRRAVEIGAIRDDAERDKALMQMTRDLTAKLVKAWSFPQDCTFANVVEFFKQAPQMQKAVDMAAANRSLFSSVESAN